MIEELDFSSDPEEDFVMFLIQWIEKYDNVTETYISRVLPLLVHRVRHQVRIIREKVEFTNTIMGNTFQLNGQKLRVLTTQNNIRTQIVEISIIMVTYVILEILISLFLSKRIINVCKSTTKYKDLHRFSESSQIYSNINLVTVR